MEYKVKITPFAFSQLSETVNYITNVLLVPETAAKWLDVLQSSIALLSSMPNRFPLTEEEPWLQQAMAGQTEIKSEEEVVELIREIRKSHP